MRFLAVLMLCLSALIHQAHAAPPACNAAAEGTIIYNKDHKIVQFCNGTQWIGMVARIGDTGDTLADMACANNEIAKWNGTTWACAADASGMSSLPALTSASIWVGNGSNVATAVAMSGDATLSNAGVLTIGSNAVGSAEITNASIALADLSATGTASGTTYLRGDNTWATISGADNLGNHTATTNLQMGTNWLSGDGGNEGVYISPAGNVGIGTSITTYSFNVGSTTGGGTAYFGAQDGTNEGTQLYLQGAGSFDMWAPDVFQNNLRFWTNSTNTNTVQIFNNSTGVANLTVEGSVTAASFAGSGASLTTLPAANLTGTLPAISGANLTTLNASNLASGTVAAARLGAGTADSTTYLRGDGSWAVPTGGSGSGANYQSFTTVGANTWTKPSSGNIAFVECWGGGGGGGRHSSAQASFGGGGGGYSSHWIPTATLPATVTVTVGAGGTAAASNTSGGVGGNSSFGSYLSAYGGGGGGDGTSALEAGGGGGQLSAGGTGTGGPGLPNIGGQGTGGDGSIAAETGFYHGGGGAGINGTASSKPGASSVYGGGGGASRYSTAAGAAGGLSAFGGNGGASGSTGGTNGSQPGGGGGASRTGSSGAGGAGQCNVTVF